MQNKPQNENYSQRSNPDFEKIMAMRTATIEAAFLIPHLKPGMRVLDVGCGPGSITLGLAEIVSPGEAVGIDLQSTQVDKAETLRTTIGILNARFEVADVYKLPFPDQSFDAVFANSVMNHLKDPVKALTEIRRVLRPDGIVGIRDLDWGGRIHAPTTPLLEKWYSLTVKVRLKNGGNPFMGRTQRKLLLEAEFLDPIASVSTWALGTLDETKLCGTFLKAQLQGFSTTAIAEGWVDQTTIEKISNELDSWALLPDAFYMDTYCEARAWVR